MNSHVPDPQFEDTEPLYLRFPPPQGYIAPEDRAAITKLTDPQVRFPDFSVNRGKYSKPSDVLRPQDVGWGVAQFQVGDVPQAIYDSEARSTPIVYTFRVEHVPLPENYAHSEVRTYADGSHLTDKRQVRKKIRKEFRERLRRKMAVPIEPRLAGDP